MQNRFVHIGFSLALAAIFLALVILGTDAFIPHPDFNKERGECWSAYEAQPKVIGEEGITPEEEAKLADQRKKQQECNDAIDAQEKPFLKKVFIASIAIGSVGVAASVLFLPKVLPLAASGVTFGGLFAILYGMMRAAPVLDKRLMFVVALFAFFLLLWVAWRWKKRQEAMRGGL